jgi:hypothetical protein
VPTSPSGRGDNPRRTVRFDPLQLDWVEGFSLTHGLNFSSVVRLAVARLIESEFAKMDSLGKLFEVLDWQTRKLEALILSDQITVAGSGPSSSSIDREIITEHEREVLYDQALSMLRTLLEIAESKAAAENPEIKIDALLAANALTRTAEAFMNDYERSVTKAHMKQMRDYIERLRQASGKSNQGSPPST